MLYNNILATIGQTPLVKINNLKIKRGVRLYLKLEGQNPGGSIKDRAALFMVGQAEKRGELKKDMNILEATSGNMGIALAMIGAQKKYAVTICMSEAMSVERRKMLKALGARLILTPAREGTEGAIAEAKRLCRVHPGKYWFARQFDNPDNPAAYGQELAAELLAQLPRLDRIIAGSGTTGTFVGLSRALKKMSPATKVIAVIPPGGYKIQGMQNPAEDFHGRIFPQNKKMEIIRVTAEEAYATARLVARKEGIFVGMSTGATVKKALEEAEKMDGGTIVAIAADRGEKYLSTALFE